MRLSAAAILFAVVSVCLVDGQPAFALSIDSTTNVHTLVIDGSLNQISLGVEAFNGASHEVGSEPTVSSAAYSLLPTGFEIIFDHSVGTAQSVRSGSLGWVWFTTPIDTPFLVEGEYAAQDADGRRIYQRVELLDTTTGSRLLDGWQRSEATPNESFSVGETSGDHSNFLTGSVVGTLLAGHLYRFEYNAFIEVNPLPVSESATSAGFFRLSTVPEPSTALLIGLGLARLASHRRYPASSRSRTW